MRTRTDKVFKTEYRFYSYFLTGLLLATVIGLSLGSAVFAEKVISTPTDCSINLKLQYKDADSDTTKQMTGGEITVYKVSDALEDNGNKYFNPQTSGQFQSLAKKNTEDGKAIAAIKGYDSKELTSRNAALAKILAANCSGIKGTSATISKGSVTVSNLTPGLYLLVQTKESSDNAEFAPFLFSIPDPNGKYQIEASPKPSVTKKTEDKPKKDNPPGGNKLPQTGQLWWPVPILLIAGLFLILVGVVFRKKTRE